MMKRIVLLVLVLLLGIVTSVSAELNPGDVVTFGHYEQDNDPANGPEPIEWTVLKADDSRVLLISCYGLTGMPYHKEWIDVTWETCSLRQWLNSEFFDTAFDPGEKELVPESFVVNQSGGDTSDHVFLLSVEEAESCFTSNEARRAEGSPAALAGGAQNGRWWLRSPGVMDSMARLVDPEGVIGDQGDFVDAPAVMVRPVLWLNSSAIVTATETPTATMTPEPTTTPTPEPTMTPTQEPTSTPMVLTLPEIGAEWDPAAVPVIQSGNIITLGSYNGKPVRWLVLDTMQDGRAFLLSADTLEQGQYHTAASIYTTWEGASLRSWLNGEFLDEVFPAGSAERSLLLETLLENGVKYDMNNIPAAQTPRTTDLVFLLSVPEYRQYQPIIEEYDRQHYTRLLDFNEYGKREYWLRSQGADATRGVTSIFSLQGSYDNGRVVNRETGFVLSGKAEVSREKGIRPVVIVDLAALHEYYGVPAPAEIPESRPTPDPSAWAIVDIPPAYTPEPDYSGGGDDDDSGGSPAPGKKNTPRKPDPSHPDVSDPEFDDIVLPWDG